MQQSDTHEERRSHPFSTNSSDTVLNADGSSSITAGKVINHQPSPMMASGVGAGMYSIMLAITGSFMAHESHCG
jgi:hypothetical protein